MSGLKAEIATFLVDQGIEECRVIIGKRCQGIGLNLISVNGSRHEGQNSLPPCSTSTSETFRITLASVILGKVFILYAYFKSSHLRSRPNSSVL